MALVEDLEDKDEDSDDDALAHVMTNVVISSLLEDGDDGEGSLLDAMMQGDENEADAQFLFIKKIAGRLIGKLLRKTRLGKKIRSRFCVGM